MPFSTVNWEAEWTPWCPPWEAGSGCSLMSLDLISKWALCTSGGKGTWEDSTEIFCPSIHSVIIISLSVFLFGEGIDYQLLYNKFPRKLSDFKWHLWPCSACGSGNWARLGCVSGSGFLVRLHSRYWLVSVQDLTAEGSVLSLLMWTLAGFSSSQATGQSCP